LYEKKSKMVWKKNQFWGESMFHEFFHIKTIISYHIHFFMLLDNERICGDEGDSDMSVGDFCRQYRGMPRA